MNIDVEVLPVKASYEGELLIASLPKMGLCRSIINAVSLVESGAVLINGQAVMDLNYRLPRHCLVVVGQRGIRFEGDK
jgi:ribosomal protein S4